MTRSVEATSLETDPSTKRIGGPAPSQLDIPRVVLEISAGIVIGLLAFLTFGSIKDPDTFWHLRIGRELPKTWQFSGPDPWNTFATRPWTLHEWLPELVMAQFAAWGGLPAVATLMLAATAALLGVLFGLARQFTSLLPSSLLVAVCFLAMFPSLTPRPHLITFAFAAISASAWLRTQSDRRIRWWLIPLAWVWACSHGMWFIGVAVGLAAVIGMLIDRELRGLAPRAALVPLGGLVVTALTPSGFATVLSPLTVRGYTEFVSEWVPPSIFQVTTMCALGLLAVPILYWARSGARAGGVELMLVVTACGVALAYSRSVAIGAAMAVPLAAHTIGHHLPREPGTRREWAICAAMASAAVLIGLAQSPAVAREPGYVPTAFSGMLDDLPDDTVVCNSYELGGWLLWRHPNLRPIIDGRTEIYELAYVEDVVNWQAAGPRWRQLVTDAGCEAAIVSSDSAIALDMRDELGWSHVKAHRGWTLLVPPR